MTMTRRTLAIGAVFTLAVLGTAWALEHRHASTKTRTEKGPALTVPTKKGDFQAPATGRATDAQPAYDRSDLLVSQG
jgi:hypothetical protein